MSENENVKKYKRIISLPFECKHCGTNNRVTIPFHLTQIEIKRIKEVKKQIK